MKASVFAQWWPFTVPLEGLVPHFYSDVKGLVTIGVGNLVDPVEAALGLTMYRTDGVRASRAEVREDWTEVKSNPHAARLGHLYTAKLTRLRMRDDDIRRMVEAKLLQNENVLRQGFPDYDSYSADAQLAMHSMAWACGPWWWQPGPMRFTKLAAACRARDWLAASNQCHMNETNNHGLVPRNKANKMLFRNAHVVQAQGMDPDPVYFPRDLYAETQDSTPTVEAAVPAREEREQVYTASDEVFEAVNPVFPRKT